MKVSYGRKLTGCVLGLILVSSVFVPAGDVVVQEGVVRGLKFATEGCTVSGTKAVALGSNTVASGGNYAIALGGGDIGGYTTAAGVATVAVGYDVTAAGVRNIAIGKDFTNTVADSFAVGFGQKDFSVESGLARVYDDLYVSNDVDANTYSEHSVFYDKDTYGKAIDYLADSSETTKIDAEGRKEYNHEGDPPFLKTLVTVKEYDKYTEQNIWNEELCENETVRTYETHQELRSSLSMKVAWLRQCVSELKQENETLKTEIGAMKAKLGME